MLAVLVVACGGTAEGGPGGSLPSAEPEWVMDRVVSLPPSPGVGCLRTVSGCGLLPQGAPPGAAPAQVLENAGPTQVLRREGFAGDCLVSTVACP